MAFKLRRVKLDWRGKLLKLRSIVLSGSELVELDPKALEIIDLMRSALRGQLAEGTPIPEWPKSVPPLMWEPFSDERGKTETLYGWTMQATMYCVDGKPWWLLRVANQLDTPHEKSLQDIERAVDFFGADVKRDRIMNCQFGSGRGYAMWWTWLNQFPMLELQFRKEPVDMRIVQEGTPLPPGYVRYDRKSGTLGRAE